VPPYDSQQAQQLLDNLLARTAAGTLTWRNIGREVWECSLEGGYTLVFSLRQRPARILHMLTVYGAVGLVATIDSDAAPPLPDCLIRLSETLQPSETVSPFAKMIEGQKGEEKE
jgi:hypothetical protein